MGNKAERHRAIQEIVRREEIGTQKELVERLRQLGFEVTQATVSRDIAELGLARIALGKGRHRYVLPAADLPENAYEELKRQFGLFVRDVDRGGNLLVVKTAEGHASGIAYLLDRLRRDEIVGTLAGDDTILVVARTEEAAQALEDEFAGLLVEEGPCGGRFPVPRVLELFLKSFLTLFVVMDPVGLVPVFVALAGDRPHRTQVLIARKAVLVAGGCSPSSTFSGGSFWGTWGSPRGPAHRGRGAPLPHRHGDGLRPPRAGDGGGAGRGLEPGGHLRLSPRHPPHRRAWGLGQRPGPGGGGQGVPYGFAVVLFTAYLVLFLAYLFLRGATAVRRALGRTGVNVVTRVLGLLLAALAVQYVADGVKGLL